MNDHGRNRRAALVAGISAAAAAAIIAAALLAGLQDADDGQGGVGTTTTTTTTVVFHATLADPGMYADGVYTDTFFAEKGGAYSFRFVPSGSSPEILSVSLDGPGLRFSEDFVLEGTLHRTPISEYFTWDYAGQRTVTIPGAQLVSVTIDPNGNVMGSVSVGIVAAG